MFGSNYPMIAPDAALADLDALGLDHEPRELFLAGNARRVLGSQAALRPSSCNLEDGAWEPPVLLPDGLATTSPSAVAIGRNRPWLCEIVGR